MASGKKLGGLGPGGRAGWSRDSSSEDPIMLSKLFWTLLTFQSLQRIEWLAASDARGLDGRLGFTQQQQRGTWDLILSHQSGVRACSWVGHSEWTPEKLSRWCQQKWHFCARDIGWVSVFRESIRDYQVSQRPDSGKPSIPCVWESEWKTGRGWALTATAHFLSSPSISATSFSRGAQQLMADRWVRGAEPRARQRAEGEAAWAPRRPAAPLTDSTSISTKVLAQTAAFNYMPLIYMCKLMLPQCTCWPQVFLVFSCQKYS